MTVLTQGQYFEYLVSTSLEVISTPNPHNPESSVSNTSTQHLVGIIVSLVVIVILGQAHDMFSRIFRIRIYKFFLPNIM
jgi:hypothetical protein